MRKPIVLLSLLALMTSGCAKEECPEFELYPDFPERSYHDSVLVGGFSPFGFVLPCNGHPQLCDRRLDEVFFAMTHNSHANTGPFSALAANQNGDVTAQLNAGIRGLNIKPYWTADANCGEQGLYLYHGFPVLGCEPFMDYLTDVREFLDEHPREVIVMTIEGDASTQRMDSLFNHTGLRPFMLDYNGAQWPTLSEMIASGKRLVVFADRSDAESFEGFHRMWNHIVDVNYDHQSTATFDCTFDRGNPNGSFFLLNHFLTNITPQAGSAAQTNAYGLLYERALQCWQSNSKRPNFVMVDFYATGDVVQVVDSLNLLH